MAFISDLKCFHNGKPITRQSISWTMAVLIRPIYFLTALIINWYLINSAVRAVCGGSWRARWSLIVNPGVLRFAGSGRQQGHATHSDEITAMFGGLSS